MRYKIAQTKDYIAPSSKYLLHSAKGTTWKNHKYIKVEGGKYFYPSDYEGGRHIDGDKDDPENTIESREPAGWDTKLFSSFEKGLKGADGKLDPKAVQQMLLFGKDKDGKGYDNFKVALNKAGIDTSEIDEKSLNLMRYKVVEHYKKKFAKEKDSKDSSESKSKSKSGSSADSKEKSSSKSKSGSSSGAKSKSGSSSSAGSKSKSKSDSKSSKKDDEKKTEKVDDKTKVSETTKKKKKNDNYSTSHYKYSRNGKVYGSKVYGGKIS